MQSNRAILLCLPLVTAFFFGCSSDEALPSTYDELENRIKNAVAKNDLDGLESLFHEMPQQWRNTRPVAKEVLSALSESGFTTRRVKFLHSPKTLNQSWSIEPEEFLRLEGIRDETEGISMGFHFGMRLDLHSIGLDLVSKEPIQQGGARPPATRPASKWQVSDKPQPDAEERSR